MSVVPVQHESFYDRFMGTARYRTGNKWASILRHYRSIFGYRYRYNFGFDTLPSFYFYITVVRPEGKESNNITSA
jgi:hypothetical protein